MTQPTTKKGKATKRPRAATAQPPTTSTTTSTAEEPVAAETSVSVVAPLTRSDHDVTAFTEPRLLQDPIYRIMRRTARSDMLEVIRCRFGREHCERAAKYFDDYYMRNPLRYVRLQVGCDGPTGLHLFFPRLFHHRYTLRTLDLSRNELSADDVATLCQGLDLDGSGASTPDTHDDADQPQPSRSTCLEVLDLSYNPKMGNTGAIQLLSALRRNNTIRAVLLRCVGVDDAGAPEIASLLQRRPTPRSAIESAAPGEARFTSSFFSDASGMREPGFFLNLNENRIGAPGTIVLGKRLPGYVSLSVCKQRIRASRKS